MLPFFFKVMAVADIDAVRILTVWMMLAASKRVSSSSNSFVDENWHLTHEKLIRRNVVSISTYRSPSSMPFQLISLYCRGAKIGTRKTRNILQNSFTPDNL